MICYRDMTFCPFYHDCMNAHSCSMPLTPEVQKAAVKWWGSEDAPICVFSQKPDCHVEYPE